jgi:hypothetical protein
MATLGPPGGVEGLKRKGAKVRPDLKMITFQTIVQPAALGPDNKCREVVKIAPLFRDNNF